MTVYRILDFLQGEDLIHKLSLDSKYVACSHITCAQARVVPQLLICGQCKKVEEISISKSTIKALQHSVEQAGFHLASPQLEMNCICEACMVNSA
jgi:Fur family zinc uptake transcriptional regulator